MSHSYNLRKRPCPVIEEKAQKVAKVAKNAKQLKVVSEAEVVDEVKVAEDAKVSKEAKVAKETKPAKEAKVVKEIKPAREAKIVEETKPAKEAKLTKEKLSKVNEAPKAKLPKVEESKSKKTEETKGEENCLIFGNDSCGEFGLAKICITKKQPISMPLADVKQVACGPYHVVTLLKTGEVYTNGCNDEGALGRVTDGEEELDATPTLVKLANAVVKVTAGDSHSAFLTDKNEVFVVGNFRDEGGQVGLTPESQGKPTFEPIQLLPDHKLTDIASGSNHMLLLDNQGNVYSFGSAEQGQLGRIEPEDLSRVNDDNRDHLLTPKKVDLSNVDPSRPFICDHVYAGSYSSFATNTDKKKNRLAAWGLNNYFQLGYKGQNKQIVQTMPKRSTFTCSTSIVNVACGQHHTLFLTKSGRVFAAGRNQYGMLGFGSVVGEAICPAKLVKDVGEEIIDICASSNNASFAVNTYGALYSWGMGGYHLGHRNEDDITKPTKVESLKEKKVTQVSSGSSFTAAITEVVI